MITVPILLAVVSVAEYLSAEPALPFQNFDIDYSEIFANANETSHYRLPNHTHPETYDISINTRIDLSQFNFTGVVKIGIFVDERTRQIVLHTRQLDVSQVNLFRLLGNSYTDVKVGNYILDQELEFLIIDTESEDLNPGDRLLLEIAYNGTLRMETYGFYRSSYTDMDGSKIWLATTHFEPTDARHAFPCYDEPALKAKFTIQITHGKSYHALSNMPETRNENSDDTATTSFAETQRMSTYLVAFIVSNFPHIGNSNARRFRVYARPDALNLTQYALAIGEKVINEFESYLQVKYTYPKMDQVAIPDFPIGAMENWGLVTYKEDALFWNETIYPVLQQLRVVRIIAHEFSHQWFGNLIGVRWWTHTYLKEGFATLFQYIGINKIYPEWNIFQRFQTETVQPVMKYDATEHTRPMSFYVEHPKAVARLFDFVSYSKAGSVLYMFMHAFTEKSFTKGLTYYLNDHAHNSTTEDDLFSAIQKSAQEDLSLARDVDVYKICRSWTNQAGFPLLTVTRDYNFNIMTLSQERFVSSPNNAGGNATWWIPYNYATARKPDFSDTRPFGWLPQGKKTIPLRGTEDLTWRDWVLFNKQQTGYYRVLYDEDNYDLLIEQLNGVSFDIIHVQNRAQLIDDLYAFLKVGRARASLFLSLTSYLRRETEYTAWVPAANAFNELDIMLSGAKYHGAFRAHVAEMTERFYNSTGVDEIPNESFLSADARGTAVNLACRFGLAHCLNATHWKLVDALQRNVALPPNTQQFIIENGARTAAENELEQLWNRMVTSTDTGERALIASSFGLISNPDLLNKYLQRSLQTSNSTISAEERYYIFSSAFRSGLRGSRICIDILQKNLTTAIDAYNTTTIDLIIIRMAEYIFSDFAKREFETLLSTLETNRAITEKVSKYARELVQSNFDWIYRRSSEIEYWLSFGTGSSTIQKSLSLVSLTIIVFATKLLML